LLMGGWVLVGGLVAGRLGVGVGTCERACVRAWEGGRVGVEK